MIGMFPARGLWLRQPSHTFTAAALARSRTPVRSRLLHAQERHYF